MAEGPYSRVYWSLPDHRPAVWRDDQLLAWWVRTLVQADMAGGEVSAQLPRGLTDDVAERLQAERVIELVGQDRYRFHGLADERNVRQSRGLAGGIARAATGERDELGRYLPSNGQQPSNAGTLETAGPTLDQNAGQPATQRDEQRRDEPSRADTDETRRGESRIARERARVAAEQDAYAEQRQPAWWDDEPTEPSDEERLSAETFREKAKRHGANF